MRRVRPTSNAQPVNLTHNQQRRNLHVDGKPAVKILAEHINGITITEEPPKGVDSHYLSITVDRSSRTPCIAVSPTATPSGIHKRTKRLPYDYTSGPSQTLIKAAIQDLQMDAAPPLAHAQTAKLIHSLASIYKTKEAISLAVTLSIDPEGALLASSPLLHFDDAAFKSAKRQQDIHSLRDTSLELPVEVEAEESGIVFVKLNPDNPAAGIGTLVNGAGLAMNTVDSLELPPNNGLCANFLDTGGKATSQTVKTSFELILRDDRVRVIFVNIFGGLTDCGMIADGVILAFKEVDMKGVPVIVRLRGTNEEVGQKRIAESGLGLESFDGFEEAARRVCELAKA